MVIMDAIASSRLFMSEGLEGLIADGWETVTVCGGRGKSHPGIRNARANVVINIAERMFFAETRSSIGGIRGVGNV